MKNKSIFTSTYAVFALTAATSQAALIHHWSMDEASGDTAADYAGSNNGAWQDPGNNLTWDAGKIGNAAHLNGTAAGRIQNFDVGVLSSLAGNSQISISMWVNPDSGTGYYGLLASRSESNAGSWAVAWEGGNHFDFHTGGTGNQLDSAAGVTTGNWFHVLTTWNSDTGDRAHYINGDPAGTGLSLADTFTGGTAFGGTGTWEIGSDNCCGDRDFDGLIDDVGIFDTALTAADAKRIFDAGNAGLNVAEAAIPEPGSSALLLLSGLLAFRRRR